MRKVIYMGLFKSKYEKALDEIIFRLQMNLSNNYKDNAQDCLRELEESLNDMRASGKVKEAVLSKYDSLVWFPRLSYSQHIFAQPSMSGLSLPSAP